MGITCSSRYLYLTSQYPEARLRIITKVATMTSNPAFSNRAKILLFDPP